MVKGIRNFFSSSPGNTNVFQNNNYSNVLPFYKVSDVELLSDCNTNNKYIKKSVQDNIRELEKYIITEDRDDGSMLSDIDPDLNMLFDMNDTIQYSSRYYDNCTFRTSFNKHTNIFSMLNANIRGIATNLDKFKFLLDELDHSFPIIGLTETWLKPHNVDCFSIKEYSHEYNLRPNRVGGGVSFFISNKLMYSRRNGIQFNPLFNSIIIDIERSELRSTRHMSVILVYRPPNTDSSIFINDLERILIKLASEYIYFYERRFQL